MHWIDVLCVVYVNRQLCVTLAVYISDILCKCNTNTINFVSLALITSSLTLDNCCVETIKIFYGQLIMLGVLATC